jgi:signal transduction histidine kinase
MTDAVAVLEEHLDEGLATGTVNGESLAPLVQAADAAIHRVELLNIDDGIDATAQIEALKRRSRAVSFTLSGVSLLIALCTSWLVFRAARRQMQLAVEHEALLTTRATELEAFAGRIAHDLKAPLGTLALRLAVMKRDGETEHVDKAVRQVERIDHIIEGLLAYARAGANPPPGARARLRDIVDEVVEEARPKAEAVEAALQVDPVPPSVVACTPGALLSVLSNLLANAVKHVVEGPSPIRKIVVHVEDLENDVRVEVEDSGPKAPAGAGIDLGLATVKRIVEGFGGRLGVRSAQGSGSIFWFEIPKAESGA